LHKKGKNQKKGKLHRGLISKAKSGKKQNSFH